MYVIVSKVSPANIMKGWKTTCIFTVEAWFVRSHTPKTALTQNFYSTLDLSCLLLLRGLQSWQCGYKLML